MTRDDCCDGAFESARVQFTAEANREAFIEGAGFFIAELRGEADFHLRFSERTLERGERRRSGQESAGLHSNDRAAECVDYLVDVLIGVRRREEAGEAFLNMNAALAQVVVEKRSEPLFGRETEIEDRAEVLDARRDSL